MDTVDSSARKNRRTPLASPWQRPSPGLDQAATTLAADTPDYPVHGLDGRQFGRYLVQRKVGAGGAASVYQAYDQILGRTVALKVLASTGDDAALSRFQREANTARHLRHPHIVRTLQIGLGTDSTLTYIAMEFVEGESLAQLLTRVGHLSPEDSCRVLAPVAQALAHAHANGIVHRDVKPSNILLRPAGSPDTHYPRAANGHTPALHAPDDDPAATLDIVELDVLGYHIQPLLSDFGIARALDAPELTHIGRTVGTPAFMSPEQCAGSRDIDGRADIYALGAVLFRCLMGHAPFRGNIHQILHAHVYSELSVDEEKLAQMPAPIIALLKRSLAKDPAQRFASAGEMAQHMYAVTGDRQPADRPSVAAIPATTQTLELDHALHIPRPQVVLVPADDPTSNEPSGHVQPLDDQHTHVQTDAPWTRFKRFRAGASLLLLIAALLTGVWFWPQARPIPIGLGALQSEANPEAETVATCPATVDAFFLDRVELDETARAAFVCPQADAFATAGWVQHFEHGSIIHLDENPLVYVYYRRSGEWEQTSANRPDHNAIPGISGSDSAADARFLAVWMAPHRRSALGNARDARANYRGFVAQRFHAGVLLGERQTGAIFILNRDRLRF